MAYVHEVRVRYGECDMQRVVFNANYFVYCDDAVDCWIRFALADQLLAAGTTTDLHALGFDFMLKKTELTWYAPVKFAETAQLHCAVTRWGRSSFEVAIAGKVEDEVRFDAVITYVSIDPITQRPTSIPDLVRRALSE